MQCNFPIGIKLLSIVLFLRRLSTVFDVVLGETLTNEV